MFKPFGYGYTPKDITVEEIKKRLNRLSLHGEAHVDNLFSKTLKYIEKLERLQRERTRISTCRNCDRDEERDFESDS